MILKHWIRNTVDETIAEDAVEILESNKEGVEKMVASNAFMIEEMKAKAEKEGIKEGKEQGKSELLIKQLIKKFKILPDDCKNKLRTLPEKTIDTIGTEIFDMESIEDLKKYF
jgi:flagellar biosynthesis/type III secretory pathway protein FliH